MGYPPFPAPLPPPVPQRSWFSSNWKWLIPTVVLTPLIFVALMFGVLVSLFSGVMKSNEPYQHALSVASQDARVVRELGAPVKPGWYVTGSINTTPTSGDADLAFPLKGKIRH